MRIPEDNVWKTAFHILYGHFEYQVMLLQLFNALASFQRYINKIFSKKLDIFIIVSLAEIFVYTEDPGQSHTDAVC